jgi:uncharacterized membrane protein YkvA (DUF1232 family)
MTVGGRILELVRALPRFLVLLVRLFRDPRVSAADKALLAAAVVYVLSPLDLIPDIVPVLGQLDDLYLVALAIDRLVRRTDPDILRAHWDGSAQLLDSLQDSLGHLGRVLPGRVRERLRDAAAER